MNWTQAILGFAFWYSFAQLFHLKQAWTQLTGEDGSEITSPLVKATIPLCVLGMLNFAAWAVACFVRGEWLAALVIPIGTYIAGFGLTGASLRRRRVAAAAICS